MKTIHTKINPKGKSIVQGVSFVISTLFFVLLGCNGLNIPAPKNEPSFPDDPHVDRSFVTGQPCDAPCWYELRLGESTIDDIRATLLQLPFVDQSTLFEWNIGTDGSKLGFYFDCVYYDPPGSCGVLTYENGKLSKIVMAVQYPLTLQSSIDRLGVPKYYTANPSPNKDICSLEIYWPEKNIVAVVDESPSIKHCSNVANEQMDLDLQVVSLVYVEINFQDQQNYENLPWPDTQ